MKDNQDSRTNEHCSIKESTKVTIAEESIVTIGSNLYFNGAGLAGFQDFERKSLQWVYSVIRDGKLLKDKNQSHDSGQLESLVESFDKIAELAAQMEIARKNVETLKQTMDPHNAAVEVQRDLEKAKEKHARLKKLYTNAKKSLPVFCWSGTFESGQIPKNESLTKHSARVQIDLDGLGLEQAKKVRNLLGEDPHIEVVFRSPSRLGIKAAMLVPPCADDKEHKHAFQAAKKYVQQRYSLKIDESCNDVRRLCYFSNDPDLIFNEKAIPLNVEHWIGSNGDSCLKEIVSKKAGLSNTQQLSLPSTTNIESAQQFLERGLKQILSATEGNRHKTYRKVAYTCGGFVSAGHLPRAETLGKLVSTARKVRPEDPSDAERTVHECFAAGEKKPHSPVTENWHYLKTGPNEPQKLKANLHNVVMWLAVYNKQIWYDEFHHRTMTENKKGQHIEWDDELTLKLTRELQDYDPGWQSLSDVIVDKAVQTYAYEDKRNELTDHLDSLRWDGNSRLDTWLIDYCGVEDNAYTREAGKCWILAAVSRAFEPGTKFDHCLILKGGQGYYKSTLFNTIGGNWFCDLKEFRGKEAQEKLLGKWIIEFAEMSAVKKADNETIKSFITERADRFRPAYGKRAKDFPRTCVFGGSTNEDEFLSDSTGNRRFWPISLPKPIRINELQQGRDQLLAEAVNRFKAGEKFLLSSEAREIAELEQEQVFSVDPWEESISNYISTQLDQEFVTADQLLAHLQGPYENRFQVQTWHRMRVGKVLQHLGWKKIRVSTKNEQGKRGYAYRPGKNALVSPNLDRKEEEAKQGENFLVDNATPNGQILTNRHLRFAGASSPPGLTDQSKKFAYRDKKLSLEELGIIEI
jgi:hypothetical protein